MIDILFAVVGAAGFIAFCLVFILFVPHTDLVIVIVAVIAMVLFDFVRDLRARHRDDR